VIVAKTSYFFGKVTGRGNSIVQIGILDRSEGHKTKKGKRGR